MAGIQARLSSTRLPGKVLADLAGQPLIRRVYERTRAAELVDHVFVLTSVDPSDDPLAEFLEREELPFRRGPLEDVLARYVDLADETGARIVVRVTGDCPFVEPRFIDLQIGALLASRADLVRIAGDGGGAVEGTLGGQGALSARALRFAQASDDPRDREHVGSFFFQRRADSFAHVELEVDAVFHRPGLRLAVDEPADLELARALWPAADRQGDGLFPLESALCWLDAHPEVRALNARVEESADNRELRALARERDRAARGNAA